MKFKIAVVQFDIKQWDPEYNIKRAEQFIKDAAIKGAQVVIFPEDFIPGPVAKDQNFVDFNHKYVKIFQEFAALYVIDIVPGSIIEGDDKGWFNTSYYIDATGKILNQYRKVDLADPEVSYLSPGSKVSIFDTKYGKAGLVICWDLVFPEIFRIMQLEGVQIVYCPSYWALEDANLGLRRNPLSEAQLVNAFTVTRSIENGMVMVYCNAAGKAQFGNEEINLLGHSQITVPFHGPIKILPHNKEEVFIQEVDTDILQEAQEAYSFRNSLIKNARKKLHQILNETF